VLHPGLGQWRRFTRTSGCARPRPWHRERGREPEIGAHTTMSSENSGASVATLPPRAHRSAQYTRNRTAQRGEGVEMGRALRIRPIRGFPFSFFILFFFCFLFFLFKNSKFKFPFKFKLRGNLSSH
jgi:hypothetical protein